jgi:predicted MFS family arabinose efflux permease
MRSAPSPSLSGAAVVMLATAAGGAIANDYAIQPALAAVARDFHAAGSTVGLVATGALAGYMLGLVVLVPLVDRVRPDLLVPGQLAGLAIALGLAATTTNAPALILCFLAVGATTTVAAQSTALVGKLTHPGARGTRMGVVAAGVSAGILLSRFLGGTFTSWLGWRVMLLCFAAFCLTAALATAATMPRSTPQPQGNYFATLRSLPRLLAEHRALRRACSVGMLWFFAFNLIWVGISLRLAEPPYSLGPTQIGRYSLAGALGLVATRIAGRLADRFGPRRVILVALAAAEAGALVLLAALGHPVWTASALAIFDAGCFAAQVANQVTVVSIDDARTGALSSLYLTLYYAAGAAGTAVAGIVAAYLGWEPLALIAALAIMTAGVLTLRPDGLASQRASGRPQHVAT